MSKSGLRLAPLTVLDEIDSVLSGNHKYQASPESVGVPKETKEEQIKRYGGFLSTKFEVCI